MSRKSFINALCRRLLRDDLTTEERAKVGELIEQLQRAEQEDAAQRGGANEAISNGCRVGDRYAK
ncbi:MAG: hypothetical protein H6956_02590 [Chromatiaceae bacterium]|nr:hypothetical protein [Chromatiaceae bacterium]MCP5438962.1 hypothetical protein [Chromatiaceae bacterium]MCP5441282.1 hypothetical protein [Chromatiaceae bacterium]